MASVGSTRQVYNSVPFKGGEDAAGRKGPTTSTKRVMQMLQLECDRKATSTFRGKGFSKKQTEGSRGFSQGCRGEDWTCLNKPREVSDYIRLFNGGDHPEGGGGNRKGVGWACRACDRQVKRVGGVLWG